MFQQTKAGAKENPGNKNENDIPKKQAVLTRYLGGYLPPYHKSSIPWRANNPECPLFPPSILHDRHGCKNRAEFTPPLLASRLVEKSRSSRGNVFGERINTTPSLLSFPPSFPPSSFRTPFHQESFRGNLQILQTLRGSRLFIRNKLRRSWIFEKFFLFEDRRRGSIRFDRFENRFFLLFEDFPFSRKGGIRWRKRRKRNDVGGVVKERGWKECYGRFRSISSKQFYSGRVTHKRRWVYVILLGNARFVWPVFLSLFYKYSFLHVMRKIRVFRYALIWIAL